MTGEKITRMESMTERLALTVAQLAAAKAGKHTLHYWPNPSNPHFNREMVMKIFEKSEGVGNYATIADRESEEIIISELQKEPLLKQFSIIAEESDGISADPVNQWIIDPIDGTIAFRHGQKDFGVAIGLLHGHQPILGVIAMPAFEQMIVAQKDHGVTLRNFDGKVLRDLKRERSIVTPSLDKMLIAYDLGYVNRAEQLNTIVGKVVDKVSYATCYGSTSASNFYLAQGSIDAYFSANPTIFDIAAASAIVQELGGIVTDLQGKAIDWKAEKRSYLAALDPKVHEQILGLINNP